MRFTFRTDRPWFTIVTTLRTFQLQARDLADARETATGSIIVVAETLLEVRA